jgi:2-polyprenyl-3-methyl-5-hydroxy-6-metoxy-1,4-benzoquinol methylase
MKQVIVTSADRFPVMRWTPEMISRFWDWQSQHPEAYFTYQFGGEIAYALKGYLVGRERLLDFGCGVGHLLPHLLRYAPKVYGADPSQDSVERANARLAGSPGFEGAFLLSDLQRRGMMFDAILAVEVVEHLYDEELDTALATIRSMLAPGGVAIFTTPNDERLEASMILCPSSGEVFHRWQHVRSFNAASLGERLRAAAFDIVEAIETNLAVRHPQSLSGHLKKIAKRIVYGDPGKPHLICVAKSRGTPGATPARHKHA